MKKRIKRKIITLLLISCMILGLLPVTAFATVTDTNDWPIFTMSEYDNPETQEVVLKTMLQNKNNISDPWGTIVKEIIKQQKGNGPALSGKTLYFQELDNGSKLIMKDSLSAAYNEAAGKLTGFINGLGSTSKGDLTPTVTFLNNKGNEISNIEAEGPAFARYQLKTLSGIGSEFPGYYGDAGAITIQLFYDFKVEGLPGRFDTPDFAIGDNMAALKSKGIIYGLGGSSDSYTVKAENYNDFPNTVQKSYTYEKSTATSTEVSNSYSKDWSEETTVGVDIKLPFVNLVSAKVEQKVGYSYGISKTYSTSKSDTYTQSISDTIEVPLPPHTGIDIDVNIIDTTTSIPYTGAVRITYKTIVVYAAGISEHEDGQGSKQNIYDSFSFGNETYTAIQDLDRRIINAGIEGYNPVWLNLKSTSPGLMANTGFASAANKLRSGQPYSPYGGVFNYTSKGTTITPRKVIPIYPADRFVTETEEITLYEQQSQRLDGIKLNALNEHDVPYYGFNTRLDGEWIVVDGDRDENTDYAEIDTDRNGYPILRATAPSGKKELYLQYKPDTRKVEVTHDYISETIELKIKPVKLSNVILEGGFPDVILDDGENSIAANDYLELMALDLDDRPFTPAPNAIVWAVEEEGRGITVSKGVYDIEYSFDRAGTYQIYAIVNEVESNRIPLTVLPAR